MHAPRWPFGSVQVSPSFAAIATQVPLSSHWSPRHCAAGPGGTQDLPFGEGVNTHPRIGSQASSVHGRLSLHITGTDDGVHKPARQASPTVQALPSLQGLFSGRSTGLQRPLVGSHVPIWWHWLAGGQLTGGPRPQVPFMHTSSPLHRLLSLAQVLPPQHG